MKSQKKIIIFLLFLSSLFLSSCVLAQTNIVGVWQSESPEIGSAWLDTYQFFSNGKFSFNVNQYDELARIISIKGKYRIAKDTLFLRVESFVENQGGYISRSTFSSLHNSWSIDGNIKVIEVKQSEIKEEPISLKIFKKEDKECLLMDNAIFYRIYDNPNKY